MILPDVNVLLHAFRVDAPEHREHRSWLEAVIGGDIRYGISPQVLSSVLRIATNRRVFREPYDLANVLAFCADVTDPPQCQIIQPGPGHWEIFSDLCPRVPATGNLVQDAWFAALAIENGCEWITHDRDYTRFPGLRTRAPF